MHTIAVVSLVAVPGCKPGARTGKENILWNQSVANMTIPQFVHLISIIKVQHFKIRSPSFYKDLKTGMAFVTQNLPHTEVAKREISLIETSKGWQLWNAEVYNVVL